MLPNFPKPMKRYVSFQLPVEGKERKPQMHLLIKSSIIWEQSLKKKPSLTSSLYMLVKVVGRTEGLHLGILIHQARRKDLSDSTSHKGLITLSKMLKAASNSMNMLLECNSHEQKVVRYHRRDNPNSQDLSSFALNQY